MTEKRIRRPDYVSGPMTEAERIATDAMEREWRGIIRRTEAADPGEVEEAVAGLYHACGYEKPGFAFVSSARMAAVAGTCALAVLEHKIGWKTVAAIVKAIDKRNGVETDIEQVCAAVETAVGLSTESKVDAGIAKKIAGNPQIFTDFYHGGNLWGAWDFYINLARDVFHMAIPDNKRYVWSEKLARGSGPRIAHEKFCIVSDFPLIMALDDENRLHSSVGPSFMGRDGWKCHNIHGLAVPAHWVENPASMTVNEVMHETNAELRRIAIEQFGYGRFIDEVGAKLLSEDRDIYNQPRRLWKANVDNFEMILLEVMNSTPEDDGSLKKYVIPVHPENRIINQDGSLGERNPMTPAGAVASTFSMTEKEYRTGMET